MVKSNLALELHNAGWDEDIAKDEYEFTTRDIIICDLIKNRKDLGNGIIYSKTRKYFVISDLINGNAYFFSRKRYYVELICNRIVVKGNTKNNYGQYIGEVVDANGKINFKGVATLSESPIYHQERYKSFNYCDSQFGGVKLKSHHIIFCLGVPTEKAYDILDCLGTRHSHEINHISMNKKDNSLDNLEITTKYQNIILAKISRYLGICFGLKDLKEFCEVYNIDVNGRINVGFIISKLKDSYK